MPGWHTGRLAAFDLETTGRDPETARIVTACVAFVGGGLATQTRTWLADPGVEIPTEASNIHGVTTERAREHGRPADRVVAEVVEALVDAWSSGAPVVAFNAVYDLTIMDREVRRHMTDPWGFPVGDRAVIDPFVIDREVDKYRKGGRRLIDVCQHYGVPLDGAHNASNDAIGAARVAWAIGQRYPDIASMSISDLVAAQRRWHAERQDSYFQYLKRQGKPTDDVSGEWPQRAYVPEDSPAGRKEG